MTAREGRGRYEVRIARENRGHYEVRIAREDRGHYDTGRPSPDAGDRIGTAVATILDGEDSQLPEDAALAELVATVRAADRLTARAITLAGQLDRRRAAAEEGMTTDAALRLHTRATGGDVAMLLTAADVLQTMPATAGLFARGVLAWGHVRQLVAETRRMPVKDRQALDHHLGEHAGQLARLDPERRAWALADAIDDHRPQASLERRAERQHDTESLTLLPELDGSGQVLGRYGPENFTTLAAALDAEADAPQAPSCPGDTDGPDRAPISRGRQLADALLRLCTRRSGDTTSAGAPVRFTVLVDVDRITDQAAGQIQTAVRGRPPRLVRRALDRLSCDAALDVVVRNGVDLLAATRYRPEITAATRRAVTARDGGCRFPGCTAPVSWCDLHHVTPRAAETHPDAVDGDHHPTNLVLLCRRHHTIVHRRGWRQQLSPDGTYRLTRRGRSWTTLPRTTHQLPPPTGAPRAGPGPRAGPRAGPTSRAGPPAANDQPPQLDGPSPPPPGPTLPF